MEQGKSTEKMRGKQLTTVWNEERVRKKREKSGLLPYETGKEYRRKERNTGCYRIKQGKYTVKVRGKRLTTVWLPAVKLIYETGINNR